MTLHNMIARDLSRGRDSARSRSGTLWPTDVQIDGMFQEQRFNNLTQNLVAVQFLCTTSNIRPVGQVFVRGTIPYISDEPLAPSLQSCERRPKHLYARSMRARI